MNDLEQLRVHAHSLSEELHEAWCDRNVPYGSELSELLWRMHITLGQLAREIQLAQDGRGLAWLQQECSQHIGFAMQELTPEWSEGKPQWWLWACRKKVAWYRLIHRAAAKLVRDHAITERMEWLLQQGACTCRQTTQERGMKKKYVILYDEHIGPLIVSKNCSHVCMQAEEPPGVEEMYMAVAREREQIRAWLPMSCIRITGFVELTPGCRYTIPFLRIWPFTSRLFHRTFDKEFELAEAFLYEGEQP